MTKSQRKRRQRRINRLLEDESRWLQKVMFDLSKVREARAKLTDMRKKKPEPIKWTKKGVKSLDGLEQALTRRIEFLLELLKERRGQLV